MPPFNDVRAAYNLPPKTFDQISSKPEINAIFKQVYYNNISLVDTFVAGLAEGNINCLSKQICVLLILDQTNRQAHRCSRW